MIFRDTGCTYSHYYCFFKSQVTFLNQVSWGRRASRWRSVQPPSPLCHCHPTTHPSGPGCCQWSPWVRFQWAMQLLPRHIISAMMERQDIFERRFIISSHRNKKTGLPKIYESLKSNPNINCNDNKEEQPMAIGVTPTHANSWVDRSGKTEIQDGTYN